MEQYLAAFVNHRQDDWSDWLDLAEFIQNDHLHAGTKQTPFFTNYGFHPWKGQRNPFQSKHPASTEFVNRLHEVQDEAKAALELARQVMKEFYDRKKGRSKSYQTGDLVWLEGKHLNSLRPTKKFSDKRYGPFKILQAIGSASFRFGLPASCANVHPVFNEVLLSPYHPPAFPRQLIPPAPPTNYIAGHADYAAEH